ncbi:hypothetical protein NF552_14275 [Roseomonas mucosa]|nr:hypothetical protein NF552_14275 [Roseomonas mucosa]
MRDADIVEIGNNLADIPVPTTGVIDMGIDTDQSRKLSVEPMGRVLTDQLLDNDADRVAQPGNVNKNFITTLLLIATFCGREKPYMGYNS